MTAALKSDLDERGVERLAELIAFKLQRGDVVLLRGDLGAGKTTLARALIRGLLGDANAEVPSPTFSLAQIYDTPRLTVMHADLYRLTSEAETHEIGLSEAQRTGAVIVEWPERAPGLATGDRFEIDLALAPSAAHAATALHAALVRPRHARAESRSCLPFSTRKRPGARRISPTCRATRRRAPMRG